eukprot:TRINITY_DN1283_c0_g1_i2.p1 TRINITY_DN1283_c0_g1~~TRINITY_DN1283_c0_g1_i2.p1  ORF type:complete len:303 (-),score=33.44 TRINITY_DN1283_c0_g1_i2:581-1489(-)
MLGKRSRAVQKIPSNSTLKPDQPSDSPAVVDLPERKPAFFNTPKIFIGFNAKTPSDAEGIRSPTSPLDIKTFSGVGITHWHEKQLRSPRAGLESVQCGCPRAWERRDSEGIGLGIVAALNTNNESNGNSGVLTNSRGAIHGSKLKVLVGSNQVIFSINSQISSPRAQVSSPTPVNSKLGSSSDAQTCPQAKRNEPIKIDSSYEFAEPCISDGLEHSESYTCVITHGPNCSTKHIYTGDGGRETVNFSVQTKEEKDVENDQSTPKACIDSFQYPLADFLSTCYLCKKDLCHGMDIYMYRYVVG